MATKSNVSELIAARMGEMTPAERKVARALLSGYPTAGLETVARLAAKSGVSGPTVLRCTARLGFAGYAELQAALRAEIDERDASPLSQYAALRGPERDRQGMGGVLDRTGTAAAEAIDATFASVPVADVEAAVALLADPSRRITAAGGRFTRLLAHYLVLHLMQLRDSSAMLPDSPVERVDALASVGRRDVFVLFDFRRYEPATLDLARRVSSRGAKVVLLTDRWLSPVATVADVVLPSRVDSDSAYDSLVPSLAVVEALVAGVVLALGDSGRRRLERVEALAHELTLL